MTSRPLEPRVVPEQQPDLGRRRFARLGAAAPVVLGSLASQPVLGQTPYHCTVSGNLSGNTSYRVGQGVDCATLGASPSTWTGSGGTTTLALSSLSTTSTTTTTTPGLESSVVWPTGYLRGTLPTRQGNNACNYDGKSSVQGTTFSEKGFANVFFQTSSGSGSNASCGVAYSQAAPLGGTPATMLQVLVNATRDKNFEFAAIAIASLLSAESPDYPRYPLSRAQVIEMYNATHAGGLYFPTSLSTGGWDRETVAGFLSSLMPYTPSYFAKLMP